LIFGLCGFPKLGIAGAAWATVLGQIVGFGISLTLNLTKNKEITFKAKGFRPDGRIIADIYKVGVPSILLGSIGSVLTYLINLILGAFTMTAVAVYGVYFKLQSFIFMPVFGLNNAAMSILGYNYGARNKKRFLRAYGMLTLFCASFMVLGTAIFELFAPQLMLLFAVSSFTYGVTLEAIRVIAWGFVCAAICIAMNTVYGATDTGLYGTITSLARQLFVLLPVAGLMAYFTHSIEAVWWAFPIAEFMTLLLSTFLTWKLYKKKIEPLGNRE
jgi:Na+-driven multidrug efflux pump